VFFDSATGKSMPLADPVRQALESALVELSG